MIIFALISINLPCCFLFKQLDAVDGSKHFLLVVDVVAVIIMVVVGGSIDHSDTYLMAP